MDGNMAIAFAWDAFEKLHPRDTWPEWLNPCTVIGWSRDKQGRFIVSMTVSYKDPLGADEHLEVKDGETSVIRIDPKTLKRFVVCREPRRKDTHFKATVDAETTEVTVLIDKGFSHIVGDDLMR